MVDRPYKAKGLVIDFDRRLVTVEGEAVHLTQVEFKIVSFLARNAGRVMTYDTLISHVWGPYADDNNRILRVNMANIRRKLEKNPAEPQFILTEIGVGYRMAEDENQENDTEQRLFKRRREDKEKYPAGAFYIFMDTNDFRLIKTMPVWLRNQ